METTVEKSVSLLKFMLLIFGMFLPHRRASPRHGSEKDKYDALIGPNESLIPTEPLFCPACHVLVAHLRRTNNGIQIIKDNKVFITVGDMTIKYGDKIRRGFPLTCPNGHRVEVR